METWKTFWEIIFLAASFGFIESQRTVCREAYVGDVVFLLDSGNDPQITNNMRYFLIQLVNSFNVSRENIRVGLVQYSDVPHSEFLLSTYHHKSDILSHIRKFRWKPKGPQGNKMGLALQFLLGHHFQERSGSRASHGVPQVTMVISSSPTVDPVEEPAEAFRRAGILLYAIGFRGTSKTELRKIASSPVEKFFFFVPNYSNLGSLIQKLQKEFCETLAKAAQPVDHVSPVCKEVVLADIVFLVDSSTSIGPQNFQKVKNFLRSVVLGLEIGRDQVQVGLAQYNDNVYPAFHLNQYSQKNVILKHIQNLPYRTGGTNTGLALEVMRTSYLTEASGSRAKDGVPQIVILVTDGESNDEVQEAATRLKEDGVVMYVVGINVQDVQELQKIASEPFEKFLFNTENFNILQDVSQGILQTLCSAVEGKMKDPEFTKAYADVVFLADTSQDTSQASFQQMRDFISRVIGMLDVGRDKYRIGLAQYGGQGHTEFLLNAYQSQEEMIAHIREYFALRGGSRRTGKALRYLHDTFFQEAAGSRFLQGIPQYAVVITSGKSEDEVWDAVQMLKEKGVKVMSVGVQDFDRRELERMGTPPLIYEMQGQDGVRQRIQDVNVGILGMAETEKEATAACPTAIPADLVFLVEKFSRAMQQNFQHVVNFLKATVSSLSIHPDFVRIGLVFYNEKPRLEFSLDAFQTPAKILEHLNKLTYQEKRGMTKTGVALDFLRDEVFIQEKGSRAKQGVRQIAVVITEGSSQDDVSRPASLLRRAGVTIYAVGTQLASENRDLEKIATYPPWKHVIPLESFLQLSIVERKIKNQLCPDTLSKALSPSEIGNVLKEGCERIEKADIYFLIDGSGSIQQDNFLEMKVFMKEVIKMFRIRPDGIQFGVVQYSDQINKEFILSQYHSETSLKVAIDSIRKSGGGTMTGQALRNMAQIFADTARSNVPWYLIVITDGKSLDPVAAAAKALRSNRVNIYAIGVRDANIAELKEIAEDKVSFASEFDSLKAIQQEVVKDICFSTTLPACKEKEADIIFLIDGSESISSRNFEKMKEFMKKMVNRSNIGVNRIQIGLLQFSSSAREEFKLNYSFLKEEILEAISNVQQMFDGTHTGKALNFTLPFFDSSAGGRPHVSQYLIVITDGVAQDNVAIPAKALRDRNIIIFAIGVGLAEKSQLLQITNDPNKVYYEDNFESLKNLEKEIFDKVCSPQGCNIDLSVGIDNSIPTRQNQEKLQELLPELMEQLAFLPNISCSVPGQINTKFRYLVPDANGRPIFDSGFDIYSKEIIQKFLVHQFAKSNSMDADFLLSLGDNAIISSSANVKVLLVFTDGLDDDLKRLKETSKILRGKGFSALLMIGLEGVHKLEELQELEFGRGFSYNQPLSITLQSLPSTLMKQLDTAVERTCCHTYAKCIGEEGHRGDVGSPGKKGEKGPDGLLGYPGEEGGHGERGPHGLPGPRGEEGCPGVRGPKGIRGFSGEKGNAGEDGVDGLDGEQGSHGIPGSLGEKGDRGNRGLKGPPGQHGGRGEAGLKGDSGEPGIDSFIQGVTGETGRRGQQGRPGFDGPQGETGSVGSQGPRGRHGLPGLKGVRGGAGDRGHQGEYGYPGSQGPRGRQGPPGTLGQKGSLGIRGNPGLPGPSGSRGKAGPRGMKGDRGVAGERGPQGQQGPRGEPGLFGPDGYGSPGRKGTKGEPGFPGYPGTKGANGDPGFRGEKGAKGIRGKRGNSGPPGFVGTPGDQGPSGPRGIKGPKGLVDMMPCEIIDFTRKNCLCSSGVSKCPVFPTEVVFALDMSKDISELDFERMRNILLSLLMKMEISESNCPTGARVAVMAYNNKIDYLIRFSDYRRKPTLLQAVQKIPLKRSSGSRNLGDAMRFVARHVFKRVRSGLLTRKVAVFFQGGWTHDADSISTAAMELSALNIVPAVISFTEEHNLPDTFMMDRTNALHLFIWETESQQDVGHVARCVLCYDQCRPARECRSGAPGPLAMDMDVAFVVDSSRSVRAEVYRAALHLVDATLNNLEVAAQPNASSHGVRVALVTHTTPGFWPGTGRPPVLEGFLLTSYGHRAQMQRRIREAVDHPLQGAPALGHALEWTLEKVLLAAPLPRRAQVLFIIVASETSSWDREKLRTLSLEAKCKGITLFVLALGPDVGARELAELAHVASTPSEQHLLRLAGISDPDMDYAQGFTRAFLNLLKSPCFMDPMEGESQDYILKCYYNKEERACQQFWLGSCGGNANRFQTNEECEVLCVPKPL